MKKQLRFLAAKWIFIFVAGFIAIGAWHIMGVEKKVPVGLPSSHFFLDYWDKGYMNVSGTWTSETDIDGSLQTSSIECEKATMSCEDATAKFSQAITPLLDLAVESYEITRWDEQFITYQKAFQCVTYKYTIDRANKTATGIRERLASAAPNCSYVQENEINLILKDGFDVYWQLHQEALRENLPSRYLAFFLWVGFCFYFWRKGQNKIRSQVS